MRTNIKTKIQNPEIRNFLFILNLAFCILILLPLISEAAYMIYLKNGRVMTAVDSVKQEDGRIKIYKKGIMLELPEANILKIEEYETELTEKEADKEKTPDEGKMPVGNQLPGYLRYKEKPESPTFVEPPEKMSREEKSEEAEKEDKQSRKKHRLSRKHIESLPPTKQSQDLKNFIETLPEGVVGP